MSSAITTVEAEEIRISPTPGYSGRGPVVVTYEGKQYGPLEIDHVEYEDPQPCENISISNCVLDSWCQGVRVGCPGDGTIRNATFSNLVIHSENHGISFEYPQRYLAEGTQGNADVHDILFSNLSIERRFTRLSPPPAMNTSAESRWMM